MICIAFLMCYLSLAVAYREETCPINFCNGTYTSKGVVETFCYNNDGLMDGRCCTANNTVIGLDLRFCEIEILNITKYNFVDLIIMDLRNNQLHKLTTDELIGLFNLDDLYLPLNIKCPGGDKVWNKTLHENNETICLIQQNPCKSLEINCTMTGECIHIGPGSAKCICKPGYYGYKCMTSGEFPVTIFFSSVTVSTVVLSCLLWFAVGRDAHKKLEFM